jgi:predicted nucleotidyltransferase
MTSQDNIDFLAKGVHENTFICQNTAFQHMSHPEIIDNCKKITVEHLIDAIGRDNIVSIILYGSVARNEESYKNVNGKLFLESDLDVLVVVKNNAILVKSFIQLKRLCKVISAKLRKKWLLSYVNLSFTTEDRLLHTEHNYFHLHLKLNGKVIFGKELIKMMHSYGYDEYKKIPKSHLNSNIFGFMMLLVRSIAMSGIFDGNITTDGYNSILKSIRKLTLFMIRAMIIKDSIPLNPYDLTEIRMKRRLYDANNSALFNDLLDTYDDLKLNESKEHYSISDMQKHMVTVISQFDSIIAILTNTDYPKGDLSKGVIFGHFPLIRRLEYIAYIFLTNVTTTTTLRLGIFKYMLVIMLNPFQMYTSYYDLFVTSPRLMKSYNEVNGDSYQQRQTWLNLYNKTVQPWKYDITRE